MEVCIKVSKTDPFRKGVIIHLGRTHLDLCPVAAVLGYLGAQGSCPGPLFQFSSGRFLTRANFVFEVQRVLEAGGIRAELYAGHTL